MNRIFRFIATCCLTLCCTFAMAEGGDYALQIFLSDNSTVTCEFTKQPQMTFKEGIMTLTTPKSTIGSWEFSNVKKWNFVDAGTVAINDVNVQKPVFVIMDDAITVNSQKKDKAYIYDAAGKLHVSTLVQGQAQISLAGLPSGIYILKFAGKNTKFAVK